MNLLKKSAISLLVMGTVFAAPSAMAEVPATLTTAVDALATDGVAAITAVGGAMLTLAGVAVLFKWAKASFFS